tara:strand:+ start:3748 stop:4362 length:615 start_codon:yes stop_codon:yes gene_type:complete
MKNLFYTALDRHTPTEDAQGFAISITLAGLGLSILTHMGFVTGQTAGIAALIAYGTDLPFSAVYFALNLPFVVFAYFTFGRAFALKTLLCMGSLSAISYLMSQTITYGDINPIMAAVIIGTTLGVGMLSVIRHHGSFAGISVLALYIQQRFDIQAGWVQLGVDLILFSVALFILEPSVVAYSLIGAIIMNTILAMNHRTGRYLA